MSTPPVLVVFGGALLAATANLGLLVVDGPSAAALVGFTFGGPPRPH